MILDRLRRNPTRFSFFQAVRLLELAGLRERRGERDAPVEPVGIALDPRHEAVRFRGNLSLAFPASEIDSVRDEKPGQPPVMTVSFLGLSGAMGPLPSNYAMIAQREVRQKSTSLRDFLDLFNHRFIALFYGAWAKYRLPFAYERARGKGTDGVSQVLHALVGTGTEGTRDRLPRVSDEVLQHYAGALSRGPKSAVALGRILSEHVGHPVRVEQFVGHWLNLPVEDQTTLSGQTHERGGQCRLGDQAILGSRVWDVENTVRLVIGPLDYPAFERFLPDRPPDRDDLTRLLSLARFYLGIAIRIEVQPLLNAAAVPGARLEGIVGRALGLDSWLDEPGRTGVVGDLVV